MQRFKIILLALLTLPALASAQINVVGGKVLDAKTNQPLAFVNIVINNESRGTTTDIDGQFSIQSKQPILSLHFSYVGYKPLHLDVTSVENPKDLKIKLQPTVTELKEVVVLPGENPAHRIIKNAVANKDQNNPEQLESFSYTSYTKMYFTVKPAHRGDTLQEEALDFLKESYLMLTESVSKRKYMKPGKNHEEVIATRISGLKDPTFAVLATEFQSFSFYDEYIKISGQEYLNPLTNGSTRRYLFLLEDTLYQQADSVFVISFRPREGRNFNGMEGLLYINTDGFAVQNVIAEAVEEESFKVKIQQQYKQISGQWFPVQLNTDITLTSAEVNGQNIVGIGRSYLKDIEIAPELNRREFNRFDLEITPDATEQSEEFWDQYRLKPLSEREQNTYQVIDSIGKKHKLDLKMKIFQSLLSGKYPIGPIDIDLNRILDANTHEGFRLGLGLRTNRDFSKVVNTGGYFAYGFRDEKWKYGGDISLTLHQRSQLQLKGGYFKDLLESGRPRIAMNRKPTSQEYYRHYYLGRRDMVEEWMGGISVRALQYFKVQLALRNQHYMTTDDYFFGAQNNDVTIGVNDFYFTEAELGIKWAHGEDFIKTGWGEFSTGTKFPVVWLTISRGLDELLDGQFEYWKVDGKLEYSFRIRAFGTEQFQLAAGYADPNLPYTKLYNGKGSRQPYPIATENSFETMGINEFLADRYLTLFHRHNFGQLLVKTKYFKPEIIIANGVGFGWLQQADNHFNVQTRSFENGYFESGLVLNNIIKIEFSGLGVGAYYRYGGYADQNWKDNLAVKATMTVGF